MHALPLALTMGDGAGVGPELLLQTLAQPQRAASTWVYGSGHLLGQVLQHLQQHHPHLPLPARLHTLRRDALLREPALWHQEAPQGAVRVVDVTDALPQAAQRQLEALREPRFGQLWEPFAHLQLAALRLAIQDTLAGRLRAICTAPWNKALFQTAGLPPVGHTEVLGQDTGASPVMMLGGDRLRVSLVTTHLPLSQVPARLSQERICQVTRITHRALRDQWGLQSPRLAMAGLNPHAGEAGTMGTEDRDTLAPAVQTLRREGIQIDGPWPSDTLFAKARPGSPWPYDAVICMYHDQGLIPLKLLHFGESANITLGLPLVRTSVDHGTAYDIAGQGLADAGSLTYALDLAHRLSA